VLAFSPDAVRALGADDVALRLEAIERAAANRLPTTDEEVWRYSRIGELDLDEFVPGRCATTVVAPEGIVSADASAGDLNEAVDVFHMLNTAFADTVVIRVPAGRTIVDPVVVTHTIGGFGPAGDRRTAVFPRLVLEAGPDSEVTVVEQFISPDGDRSLVVPRVEVHVGQAARVKYLGVNLLSATTWSLGHQRATGERDSTTLLATVALGGDYARVRTEARLAGQGSSTRQIALYFADGTQMHDFRTLQDHAAPKTYSDLLFKGAVQDHARSVYTGLIKVREGAKGSVAFQTNRNLTLSEGAWAESVPNLEIETNDVKCSHASTVGPIDEEQRFYLESRGIPPEIAERLVVLGFFDEVLQQLPVGPLATELRDRVSAKLHAPSATLEASRA
jgi:Fe-S cluster assembly protein SufD